MNSDQNRKKLRSIIDYFSHLYPRYIHQQVVAVVVPDADTLATLDDPDADPDVSTTTTAATAVRECMCKAGTKAGVSPHELPFAVHIEREEWTKSNGGLTASLKLARRTLQLRYRDVVDRLYNNGKLAMVGARLLEEIVTAICADGSDKIDDTSTLAELGVDSLAIMRVAEMVNGMFPQTWYA